MFNKILNLFKKIDGSESEFESESESYNDSKIQSDLIKFVTEAVKSKQLVRIRHKSYISERIYNKDYQNCFQDLEFLPFVLMNGLPELPQLIPIVQVLYRIRNKIPMSLNPKCTFELVVDDPNRVIDLNPIVPEDKSGIVVVRKVRPLGPQEPNPIDRVPRVLFWFNQGITAGISGLQEVYDALQSFFYGKITLNNMQNGETFEGQCHQGRPAEILTADIKNAWINADFNQMADLIEAQFGVIWDSNQKNCLLSCKKICELLLQETSDWNQSPTTTTNKYCLIPSNMSCVGDILYMFHSIYILAVWASIEADYQKKNEDLGWGLIMVKNDSVTLIRETREETTSVKSIMKLLGKKLSGTQQFDKPEITFVEHYGNFSAVFLELMKQ